MPQSEDKIKRKTQKVVDNLGDVSLAQLEATIDLADKLEDVAEAVKNIPQVEIPEMPEQKEVDLSKTEQLLEQLLEESKKKEEYEVSISPEDRLKLKGDKGENGKDGKDGADGLDGKDGRDGIDGQDGKDGSPDTGNQIVDKINKSDGVISKERIEGLSDLENNVKHQLYTGISETRALELIRANTPTGGSGTIIGSDTQVLFFDGDNNPVGDTNLTYNKTTNTLSGAILILSDGLYSDSGANPKAIDLNTRQALDSGGMDSFNWDNRNLTNTNSLAVFDWNGTDIKIKTDSNSFWGTLDMSNLSADRTATFPDKDGTVAYLDDIPAAGLTQAQVLARTLGS